MQRPLAGLTRENLLRECLAGITLLAIAIPLNIGYAQIAGLPPTAGLYALIVPTLIYSIVVSSRQLVVSPDAAAAALVASSIGGLAVAGSENYATLAMAQAIVSGIMFILLAVFKLGFLATFLSAPILLGFVAGLALNIMASQVAKMLGIPIDSGAEFIEKVGQLLAGLDKISPWATGISIGSILVLILGRRLWSAVPWALVVLVVATIFVVLTHLDQRGVAVLGEVPAGAPQLTWPVLDIATWLALVPSAIALTLVTTAEGLLVSRSYSEKYGFQFRANRDLLAFGLGNIAAGAQGSFSMGSSTSRTAAMDQAGSRTQFPSVVLAAGTLLLLIFGTALLADIPSAAIGAIVAVAIIPLLGVRGLIDLLRKERFEFLIAVTCLLVTLFVGSIAGILVAFVLALINLARRAANPAIDVLQSPDDSSESLLVPAEKGALTAPGLLIVRLVAPLFFANGAAFTTAVKDAVQAARADQVLHVVIDMEAVTDVDVTGAEALEVLRQWLLKQRITLGFSRMRDSTRTRMQVLGALGDDPIFATNRDAVAQLQHVIPLSIEDTEMAAPDEPRQVDGSQPT